ncbi:MAG TPA: hypothetical protein VFR78_19615 [Pyrinomonadaceae bacterium]|nr:hypothetical protein [Pyrinomonadaceae bacterium]
MEVIQAFDRPASQRFYEVAGRLLFIESVDLRLAHLIEQLFSGWQLTPVSVPDRSPDIQIRFKPDQLPTVPRGSLGFDITDGGKCYTDDADLWLVLGGAVVHLRGRDLIDADVWVERVLDEGDPVLARAASFVVCAALRRFGVFEIHSAGVVEPASEKGVLIVGPSGSGKSTLALQLVLAGWPYLSDDELLLSLADAQVEARGFRNFFAVGAETVSRLGIEKIAPSGFKACFEPNTMFASQRRLSATPGVLLFTSLSGEDQTQIRKLTQSETMMRLIRACPWATYDTAIAGANLSVLSQLARQATAFDLVAGRDLLEPGYASRLLAEFV